MWTRFKQWWRRMFCAHSSTEAVFFYHPWSNIKVYDYKICVKCRKDML